MSDPDRFRIRRSGEGRTGGGQLISFYCPSDAVEEVKEFLAENVYSVDIPVTGRVNVSHGGYGRYTRYDVQQHKYAGGGAGYIEVLEIKNLPEERCGIVINEWTSYRGGAFTEWETVESACAAWEKYWGSPDDTEANFAKLPGFKRRVVCGALSPWFYAIGDEQLIGDYAFPEGLQDDPVFRFGHKFVVTDRSGAPSVKTCMGTRFVNRKRDYYPFEEYQARIVYWDDGSVWESRSSDQEPRPLGDGEVWAAEAVQQFKQLLAGDTTEFTINFIDGNKFVGKLSRPKPRTKCAAGEYDLVVQIKGEPKPLEGWVTFAPTSEAPDIVSYVVQKFNKKGREVEHVIIKRSKTERGGKKWAGAFFATGRK